jgi:hypothetical protein
MYRLLLAYSTYRYRKIVVHALAVVAGGHSFRQADIIIVAFGRQWSVVKSLLFQ